MKGSTSPGPNDLPSCFYHYYWDILANDIMDMVLNILNNNNNVTNLNQTLIFLIPKTNRLDNHTD